jgi:hypothetical protein
MIFAIYVAMLTCVLWGSFAHTELGWLSWIFSAIVCALNTFAEIKYYRLLQRIEKLEKETIRQGRVKIKLTNYEYRKEEAKGGAENGGKKEL